MAKRGDPDVLRHVVSFLRTHAGMTQAEFGKAARVDQGDLSRFERAKSAPSEEQLRRMAEAARLDWPLVIHLRRFLTGLLAAAARRREISGDPEALRLANAVQDAARLAVAPYLIEEAEEPAPPSREDAECEAEEVWVALQQIPEERRKPLLELARFDARLPQSPGTTRLRM